MAVPNNIKLKTKKYMNYHHCMYHVLTLIPKVTDLVISKYIIIYFNKTELYNI